ncbi:MAG: 4-hydroxy-tetrahydrodipicolinate reductase [Candidatus Omnitrophica bacterium]|nr:4-hydroxy-tetrahydrodipicolinate reductase [Candidatus Omnitrophota bacterium]
MINLAVSGCQGRMGQRITALAAADKKTFKLSALLERPGSHGSVEGIAISTSNDALKGSDILIEFTTPDATMANLKACIKHKVKMVIGTTGLTDAQKKEIKKASSKIAIVFSSNMSIGVNVFFKVAEMISAKTPNSYEVDMVEAHHIHKKDAPSGTAKTIAEVIEAASKKKVKNIESIREGEIIGDHKVIFESPEDTILIFHHAKNRDIFVKGSLVAAKFLKGKTKGLFNMQDVLGLH